MNEKILSRPSLLDTLAHSALQRAIRSIFGNAKEEIFYCIDATAGNGHDTCALAKFCFEQKKNVHILACDIQEQALENTKKRLEQYNLNAELVLCGHENIIQYLPDKANLIGAMFNLGYLPGKDRKETYIITKDYTTLEALQNICMRLIPQGCVSIHCYTGHKGGLEEFQAVNAFVTNLNPHEWRVLKGMDINRDYNLEYLFLLEKLQQKKQK